MHADHWKQVEQLFQSALKLPPHSRDPYLREACSNHPEVLREVQSLLEHHASSGALDSARFRDLGGLLHHGAPVLWPSDRLGRYEIVRSLGSGGMGAVYLARDSRLDRLVALKTLSPNALHGEDHARRFQREAKAASALNHPNIVTVYDLGWEEGLDFIASEYIEGRTLRERMTASPVPLDEALEICMQAASAVGSAHRAGIVHRDLKPENVMIRADALVKVVDFGLARMAAGEPPGLQTNAGTVLGTLPYMSPEQARGAAANAASDVWSLGVIVFELTAGRHPFAAPTAAETRANIEAANPALGQVPRPVRGLVRTALKKAPAGRYQSAEQFAAALKRAQRSVRRRRMRRVALVGAAAACMAVAAGVWRTGWPLFRFARGPTVTMTLVTDVGNVTESALSPDGRLLAYTTDDGVAQSLKLRQLATRSDLVLREPERVHFNGLTFSPDSAYLYYGSIVSEQVGSLYRIPAIGGGVPRKLVEDADSPPALSPGGSRLAFVRLDPPHKRSFLMVANSDGSSPQVLATRPFPENFFAGGLSWSPDGSAIAVTVRTRRGGRARDTIAGVRLPDARSIEITRADWPALGRMAWLRDGIFLLAASDQIPLLQVIRVSAGRAAPAPVTSDVNDYSTLNALPSARVLAMVQRQRMSGVFIASARTPDQVRPITQATGRYAFVSWAKPGTLITQAAIAGVPQLWLVDENGRRQRSLTEQRSLETNVRACAGGQYIVFVSSRTGSLRIWRTDSDGRNAVQLTDGPGDDVAPSCSPDGGWLMFSSSRTGAATLWKTGIEGGPAQSGMFPEKFPPSGPASRSPCIRTRGSSYGRRENRRNWSPRCRGPQRNVLHAQ